MDDLIKQYQAQIAALQTELARQNNRLAKAQVLIAELYQAMQDEQTLQNTIGAMVPQSDEEFFNIIES
jgi:hypothetical protein